MHKMMMLRDNLMDELEKFADKPMNEQSLDLVDKLAHAIKCIDTVSAMERAESRDGYSGRMYRDGMSGRTYRDDYSGDGYSHDEAKDRLMNEMQGMMGDVSPEAQHAIQKALNALGQE